MTYNADADKFYNRHFAAGIDDIDNITGKSLGQYGTDNTTYLTATDNWFKYTDKKNN